MDDKQDQAAFDIGAALFRKRRTLSRIVAMQFAFQADLKNAWDEETNDLEAFKELAKNILQADGDDENPSVDDRRSFTHADFNAAWKYATTLIKGVLANRNELDTLICNVTQNWSLQRISLMDRAILRVATFEILKSPKGVTPATAINEAIEIAKSYSLDNSPRFINGILDKIRKNLQEKASSEEPPAEEASTPSEETTGEADS